MNSKEFVKPASMGLVLNTNWTHFSFLPVGRPGFITQAIGSLKGIHLYIYIFIYIYWQIESNILESKIVEFFFTLWNLERAPSFWLLLSLVFCVIFNRSHFCRAHLILVSYPCFISILFLYHIANNWSKCPSYAILTN